MATFGEILKALREEKGQTQEDIARFIGVSRGAISKYENNEREPDMKMLSTLASYFGVTIDYISGKSNIRGKPDYIPENIKLIMDSYSIDDFVCYVKEAVGVSLEVDDVNSYLQGSIAPSTGTLKALADYANVDVDFFYKSNNKDSYQKECKASVESKAEGQARNAVDMLLKNRAFVRIAEKIIENDLDVNMVENLIDNAISIKKRSQGL